MQADLLHLVHGDSVPEDRLRAFLSWYSADRPETRPQRTRADNHEAQLATRHDVVEDSENNNNSQHRRNKLSTEDDEARSPPTSDHSVDTPTAAATPNRSSM